MKKINKIYYWIATIWLSLGMAATGIAQLFSKNGQGGLDMMQHLGYPEYAMKILGVSKILGVVAVLIPRLPLLKEWAYAGFAFMMLGAILSHFFAGDALTAILPALLLFLLTAISWYLRPASRKLNQLRQIINA